MGVRWLDVCLYLQYFPIDEANVFLHSYDIRVRANAGNRKGGWTGVCR